jgi:hypothetical protein
MLTRDDEVESEPARHRYPVDAHARRSKVRRLELHAVGGALIGARRPAKPLRPVREPCAEAAVMLGTSDPLTADPIGLDAARVSREITAIPANRRKRGRRVQNCRMFISHKSRSGEKEERSFSAPEPVPKPGDRSAATRARSNASTSVAQFRGNSYEIVT